MKHVFGWMVLLLLLTGCAGGGGGSTSTGANVYVGQGYEAISKVTILPFKASTELIGASVSDMLVTELMKMGRYEMVERGQLSGVLGETEVALSGLTAGQAAQLGQMVGANGVIIGTVSEYETSAQGGSTYPVVSISARLINSTTGKIIWSVDHGGRGPAGTTTAQYARTVAQEMVNSLNQQLR